VKHSKGQWRHMLGRLSVVLMLGAATIAGSITATAAPTQATPAKPIRVVTEHWPGYTSATGTGAYFEMLYLVLKPDPAPKVQLMPFARAVVATERQQADLVFAVTARDSQLLLRSNLPMDWDRIVAVYKKDARIDQAVRANQLQQLRLSWRLGYNYGSVVGVTTPGYETLSAEQGVQLALNQRVDVFLSEEDELNTPQIQQWLSKGATVQPVAIVPIYVGFAPTERGRELKQQWDHSFIQAQHTPEMQDFYRRYPGMRVPAAE